MCNSLKTKWVLNTTKQINQLLKQIICCTRSTLPHSHSYTLHTHLTPVHPLLHALTLLHTYMPSYIYPFSYTLLTRSYSLIHTSPRTLTHSYTHPTHTRPVLHPRHSYTLYITHTTYKQFQHPTPNTQNTTQHTQRTTLKH